MPRRRLRPPRERAARALCEMDGYPPEAKLDGRPLWESYLPEVDAVLWAALSPEDYAKLITDCASRGS